MRKTWLHVQAPFAAFRWLQAGVYRATSPIIPPSAAWGLALNLAGIETRDDQGGWTTLVRIDAPPLRIAIGALGRSEVATLYQQLHTYPVGNSGKELKARTYGAKYWIAPTRRELLVGFSCLIGIEGADEVIDRIERGVRGEGDWARYGLPFAGDNSFLFDRIDVLAEPPEATWYVRLGRDERAHRGTCRLTVGIDRAEASRTTTALFAPSPPSTQPPDAAWTWTPREGAASS